MQRFDQRIVELEHRLPAGNHHQPPIGAFTPQQLDPRRERLGIGELPPALAVRADEIGVAEIALGGRPVLLAAGPQIAAGKAQEHRPAAGLHPFALDGEEAFLDRIFPSPPRGGRGRLMRSMSGERGPKLSHCPLSLRRCAPPPSLPSRGGREYTVGSAMPASSKPLARRRQASQRPQWRPSGCGS